MNHGWTYTDRIGPLDAGRTALDFYAATYRHSTSSIWKARLDSGEMSRGGMTLLAGDLLMEGDVISWHRPPWEEGEVPWNYKIVYEDPDVIAIDKPAGLPVLPDGGFLENTLVNFLARDYPGEEPAPAHRLNRGTSGLILFSRTPRARASLASQFRDKTARDSGVMKKTYHALSLPFPGGYPGCKIEVTEPIGPVPHALLGTVHAASRHGKASCSRCEILKTGSDFTLWKVDLITGRPHQIRIHLASIGVPLIGEPLFQPGGVPSADALPGDCGYLLRSVSISFVHPATGGKITISVPGFEDHPLLCRP